VDTLSLVRPAITSMAPAHLRGISATWSLTDMVVRAWTQHEGAWIRRLDTHVVGDRGHRGSVSEVDLELVGDDF
jgi:hypothetical protein